MRLANIRNGLAFPHDEVCYFQSCHGHQFRTGYFRGDAMPYSAVIHLLKGGSITIVDGTSRGKRLTDAQKFGLPTWCLVFNRALGQRAASVCDWQTRDMRRAAHSVRHKPVVQSIRKLAKVYGSSGLAVIGENVHIECHQNCEFDDHPERLAELAL